MRRYAVLKNPIDNGGTPIVKIMLYETAQGVYLFAYSRMDAQQCDSDLWYETIEEVYDTWNGLVDANGWIAIDDPLPYCQHDAFLPLRVKGRDTGNPQWGTFELYDNGVWKEYVP